MQAIIGSLIATTFATLPCLDQKDMATEVLKATPSNEVQGWKDGICGGFQQFHKEYSHNVPLHLTPLQQASLL